MDYSYYLPVLIFICTRVAGAFTWLCFLCPIFLFLLYLVTQKLGAIAYNVFHHQGVWAALLIMAYYIQIDELMKISLIFLAHSTFDRVAGYGLKYFDSFDHTHLGWIGKSKHLNKE